MSSPAQSHGCQAALLPDGKRLHIQHGPTDLIIEAFGETHEISEAYRQAGARMDSLLDTLVLELPELRTSHPFTPKDPVARRMLNATTPHIEWVTPMASVAGAIADEVLAAMTRGRVLEKAYVNNGGDCALYLGSGASLKTRIAGMNADITITHGDGIGGIATSGWRGRSQSLGIADSVTVLADNAAGADTAATLIANAVDLPNHSAIKRVPANRIKAESDLGERLVTTGVGRLNSHERETALQAGLNTANRMKRDGLIEEAILFLGADCKKTETQRKLINA